MKPIKNLRGWHLLPGERSAGNYLGLGLLSIRTQAETAKIMGCTTQNVQQLERSALRKIREGMREIIEERKWTDPWQ